MSNFTEQELLIMAALTSILLADEDVEAALKEALDIGDAELTDLLLKLNEPEVNTLMEQVVRIDEWDGEDDEVNTL